MSETKYNPATVLSAVSSFISHHDKEDYAGVIILARQRDDLYQIFNGGTADDPESIEEWMGAPFIIEQMINDIIESEEPEKPKLQMITAGDETAKPEPQEPDLSIYPKSMQEVYYKSLHPGTRLNDDGELIDDPGVYHPRQNDKGEWVLIHHPTHPLPMSAFADHKKLAIMLPNGQSPAELNGIAFQPWQTAPKTLAGWVHVTGQKNLNEPAFNPKNGKKLAAGVVVIEPDGRYWLVAPTNAFGGYKTTFPKGRLEPGMGPQATAIKEAYEEAGLQVEITGLIGDFERTTTITRYYTARRIGGVPTQMEWESQAVMLVPKVKLLSTLNHDNDHNVIHALDKLATANKSA